jgi:hypothetical protein
VGGIAGYSGCKFVEGVLVPGRIIDCLNRAAVTGNQNVGGIAGSFLGEMYRCGNEGTIVGRDLFGGLLTMGSKVNPSGNTPVERRFIVSDCYNAGLVSHDNTLGYFAGLLGTDPSTPLMADWRDDDNEYEDFKVSSVFNYGGILPEGSVIIAPLSQSAGDISFSPYDITQIFSNTYYRVGIGARLFNTDNLNGTDRFGTSLVKGVIKGKTTEEFASAAMAALLNNGRTGADAPWEYVAGNPYPTLKAPENRIDSDTGLGVGGGGCDTGAAMPPAMAAMAAALALAIKRRKG